MKQRFLLFVFAFAFFGLRAQDVPEKQTPMITKITATWCSNCGTWGWDFFKNVLEDNKDRAIMLGAHFSGDLDTPVGKALSDNFNAFGQPRFFMNNTDLQVSRSNIAAKRTEMNGMIDDFIAQSPVANVGFEAEIENGMINVRAKTKFFQNGSGEYYLGLYVIENDVLNNQSGQGMAMHPNVVRTTFTSDVFGNLINTDGDPVGGMTENVSDLSVAVNQSWDLDNVSVVGVIWKKDGDTFQFVNANRTNDFSGINTSSVDGIFAVDGFEVVPNIITETATVQINVSETLTNAQLSVFDITGKKVTTVFNGNLNAGIRTFHINRNEFNSSGMYFLTLENGGKVMTQKLMVK